MQVRVWTTAQIMFPVKNSLIKPPSRIKVNSLVSLQLVAYLVAQLTKTQA